jgi:hypothetical protein
MLEKKECLSVLKGEVLTLNGQDLARLVTLSKSSLVRGCSNQFEYEDLLRDWIEKLKGKIWIEGTPWNIPDEHKQAIVKQLETLNL